MKVLWLINSPIPDICKALGMEGQVKEGWISGLYNAIKGKVDLSIAFPQMKENRILKGTVDGMNFYGFYKEYDRPYEYNVNVEKRLKEIVDEVKPDVVHIAGTEYEHALAMTKAFNKPSRTVVSIQGLTSVYEKHYMANLPHSVQVGATFRDIVKRDNLMADKKKYHKRGLMEIETIKNVGHIIGRTDWDRACTYRVNDKARYYHCGEILRNDFYTEDVKWSADSCINHSIFVSQGYYPIKGLHFMLEALNDIVKFYPDAKLYVAGGVTLNDDDFKKKLRQKNYQKYLAKMIKEYNLYENVEFLPPLGPDKMKEMFLSANVFVSPSSIENSPNSLGEAMILGVPCVSSHVGGVANMMTHDVEGFVYQADAPYMLAHYVMEYFRMPKERLDKMRAAAMEHAAHSYNREINSDTMLDIYHQIYESNK